MIVAKLVILKMYMINLKLSREFTLLIVKSFTARVAKLFIFYIFAIIFYFKKKLKIKSIMIRTRRIIEINLGIFSINLSVRGFTIYKNMRQALPQTRLTSKEMYLPKLYFISV